jgi:hypothetical protein
MADKPEEPKEEKYLQEIILFFLFLFFIYNAYLRVRSIWHVEAASTYWGYVVSWAVHHLWPFIKIMGVVVSAGALFGIVYFFRKLTALQKEENAIYQANEDRTTPSDVKNGKWERVIQHINSTNAAEWRLAIIEADVMLEELLRVQNYHGESIGEMLKAVEPSDMLTLDNAWEAHKVRNQIAHDGADFELTERDARRVISLYESVFKEFKLI